MITKLSNQQVFDKVWDHFITKKNPPSIRDDGRCVYRGPDGSKCAIGIFIPDEKYFPEMDVNSGHIPLLLDDIILNVSILYEFRRAHDSSAHRPQPSFHEKMKLQLIAIAVKHRLTYPSENELPRRESGEFKNTDDIDFNGPLNRIILSPAPCETGELGDEDISLIGPSKKSLKSR
jgi:hypothetical protein